MEKQFLMLQTSLTPEELRDRLTQWEPWSIRVDFSNGVSTKDFKRRSPFDADPLNKFGVVEAAIPFAELSGGRMLDIDVVRLRSHAVSASSLPVLVEYDGAREKKMQEMWLQSSSKIHA